MAYGYNANKTITESSIQLPPKIRCKGCRKVKGHHCYSQKRLDQLRSALATRPELASERAEFISCCSCTCDQQFEFECQGCDRVLPRKVFSKNQLSGTNRDKAICNKCMADRLNDEPGNESSLSDSDSDGSEDSDDSHTAGTRTVAITFSALSIGNRTSGIGSSNGGVALPSISASRASSTVGAMSTASTVNTTPAHRILPSQAPNRLTAPAKASNNANFAKVGSGTAVQKHYADATRRQHEWEAGKTAKDSEDALDAVEVQDSDSDED